MFHNFLWDPQDFKVPNSQTQWHTLFVDGYGLQALSDWNSDVSFELIIYQLSQIIVHWIMISSWVMKTLNWLSLGIHTETSGYRRPIVVKNLTAAHSTFNLPKVLRLAHFRSVLSIWIWQLRRIIVAVVRLHMYHIFDLNLSQWPLTALKAKTKSEVLGERLT